MASLCARRGFQPAVAANPQQARCLFAAQTRCLCSEKRLNTFTKCACAKIIGDCFLKVDKDRWHPARRLAAALSIELPCASRSFVSVRL